MPCNVMQCTRKQAATPYENIFFANKREIKIDGDDDSKSNNKSLRRYIFTLYIIQYTELHLLGSLVVVPVFLLLLFFFFFFVFFSFFFSRKDWLIFTNIFCCCRFGGIFEEEKNYNFIIYEIKKCMYYMSVCASSFFV